MEDMISISFSERQQSILDAFKTYSRRLFSFIRRRVRNDQDAEDILQDVWYALSSMIDTEPVGQMNAWLYRVTRNRIADKKRKQSPLLIDDLAYFDEDGELVFPAAIMADEEDIETEFTNRILKEAFFKALAGLPEKQRQVFVWNELEDMTLREIAEKTGESIKTITSRKQYAVKHLRKELLDFYNDL